MSKLYLGFCPYLSASEALNFAEWQLAPLEVFEDRWANPDFKALSETFLQSFVDAKGEKIDRPCLLGPKEGLIDGRLPTDEEVQALQAAIAFAFLDENPRRNANPRRGSWNTITTENTDLHFWPIDLESGWVTIDTGFMVRTRDGGYKIGDEGLVIRPPVDLHMPLGSHRADPECLEAIYTAVLKSLNVPGATIVADRIRVAVDWLTKAWRNTGSLQQPERVVFLKTGFEALTGTSYKLESARILRTLFETIPGTSARDSDLLVWSPTECATHPYTYRRDGRRVTEQLTDLEHWFIEFSNARNTIIHEGIVPSLIYTGRSPHYVGHFIWTAEFLLRVAIKVSLAALGFPNLWRSDTWRAFDAAMARFETEQQSAVR